MDSSFTYTCINPAFGEGLHGFQVLQQITPFRQSKVQVHNTYSTMYLFY